jgi:ribose transport system substrate-binding protein
MKRLFLSFVLFSFCLSVSCNRGKNGNAGGTPRIALVMKTQNNPFFIDMQRGAEEAARRLGVSLIVQAAERDSDVERQMQIIENLIQTDLQALCVTPSGSTEIVPALVKAEARGIPVLIVDTRLDSAAAAGAGVHAKTFIGSDNYEGGRLAGEFLISKFGGKARLAILEGVPGHETNDSRLRGFHSVIDLATGMEIVASQAANFERDQGFNVFQNILQAHPEVQALFACNDMMALGAVEAVAAAGKAGEVTIIGFDAIADARQAIKAGTLAASVAQFPDEMGRMAVESAVKIINGEALPSYLPVKIDLVKF